jgi:hypothetical protein
MLQKNIEKGTVDMAMILVIDVKAIGQNMQSEYLACIV